MRLLYLEPNALGIWDRRVKRVLAAAANPRTTVDVAHLENLPDDMVSVFLPRLPFYYSELFRAVHRAEEQGYEAVIIGCSADPGVRDAAHMARIPVLGPFKAALHLAGFMGGRLAVISPGYAGVRRRPASWHYDSARLYGMADRVASFRVAMIERPSDAELQAVAREQPERVVEILDAAFRQAVTKDVLTQARLAVQEDNATAIYLGCTLWGGYLAPLAAELEVPVIDPVAGCVNMAEALAGVRRFRGV
jgi:allantoin racemase